MTRQPAARPVFTASLAVALAASIIGTPAYAGGGVRLNFGGPLGTFVATPTPGYGGNGGVSDAKPKSHAAKRPPTETAERSRPKSRARQDEARIVPVRHTAPSNAPKALPITADETSQPGLLGRTLALDSLPRAETVRVLGPAETITAVDASEQQAASAQTAAPAKASDKVAAVENPATCRKFIPAVGVTVTVACD